MARVKIGTLSNPDTHLDKHSGNAIANSAVAIALESLIPNYLKSKSDEAFKRSTDKLIVKNNEFEDLPASVHVFRNEIFSGPDGLMIPTDLNFIFIRQMNHEGDFVYSNNGLNLFEGSFNTPAYDPINDRYILTGSSPSDDAGIFCGVPVGSLPLRQIEWSKKSLSLSACQPSCFIVDYNGSQKCISLIGKACSNDGGTSWLSTNLNSLQPSRAPSAIIGNVVVACKPSFGLECSQTLVPEMFKSNPQAGNITWDDVSDFSDSKFTGLTVATKPDGTPVIYAKSNGLVIASTDGINWSSVFSYDERQGSSGIDRVFVTDEGILLVSTGDSIYYLDESSSSATMEMCDISDGDWRTPTKISDGNTTLYVTTKVASYGLAVSANGKSWSEITSINFSDTADQGLIGNPVVYDYTIYFPTNDGINYIRSMPISEFFEMTILDRMISDRIAPLPDGESALFTADDLRDKINEIACMVNAILKIVKS